MEMIPVVSSDIRLIGYDSIARVLKIEFCSGWVYEYHSVPEHVFEELKKAESKGKFLYENIKSNYRYQRIQ